MHMLNCPSPNTAKVLWSPSSYPRPLESSSQALPKASAFKSSPTRWSLTQKTTQDKTWRLVFLSPSYPIAQSWNLNLAPLQLFWTAELLGDKVNLIFLLQAQMEQLQEEGLRGITPEYLIVWWVRDSLGVLDTWVHLPPLNQMGKLKRGVQHQMSVLTQCGRESVFW